MKVDGIPHNRFVSFLCIACMTTEGKQCIFPFKYKNESGDGAVMDLEFKKCSTEDIYRPWCPTSN